MTSSSSGTDAGEAGQPIYEKDRLDPVDPAATLTLDPDVLARFPEGYRYLAYLQVQVGYPVKPDMPGLTGPEVEKLYQRGAAWLGGQPVAPFPATITPGRQSR